MQPLSLTALSAGLALVITQALPLSAAESQLHRAWRVIDTTDHSC